jgi:hypothetical protein
VYTAHGVRDKCPPRRKQKAGKQATYYRPPTPVPVSLEPALAKTHENATWIAGKGETVLSVVEARSGALSAAAAPRADDTILSFMLQMRVLVPESPRDGSSESGDAYNDECDSSNSDHPLTPREYEGCSQYEREGARSAAHSPHSYRECPRTPVGESESSADEAACNRSGDSGRSDEDLQCYEELDLGETSRSAPDHVDPVGTRLENMSMHCAKEAGDTAMLASPHQAAVASPSSFFISRRCLRITPAREKRKRAPEKKDAEKESLGGGSDAEDSSDSKDEDFEDEETIALKARRERRRLQELSRRRARSPVPRDVFNGWGAPPPHAAPNNPAVAVAAAVPVPARLAKIVDAPRGGIQRAEVVIATVVSPAPPVVQAITISSRPLVALTIACPVQRSPNTAPHSALSSVSMYERFPQLRMLERSEEGRDVLSSNVTTVSPRCQHCRICCLEARCAPSSSRVPTCVYVRLVEHVTDSHKAHSVYCHDFGCTCNRKVGIGSANSLRSHLSGMTLRLYAQAWDLLHDKFFDAEVFAMDIEFKLLMECIRVIATRRMWIKTLPVKERREYNKLKELWAKRGEFFKQAVRPYDPRATFFHSRVIRRFLGADNQACTAFAPAPRPFTQVDVDKAIDAIHSMSREEAESELARMKKRREKPVAATLVGTVPSSSLYISPLTGPLFASLGVEQSSIAALSPNLWLTAEPGSTASQLELPGVAAAAASRMRTPMSSVSSMPPLSSSDFSSLLDAIASLPVATDGV